MVDLGLNANDAYLLMVLKDFIASGKMNHIEVNGQVLYWVSYKWLEEELPCFGWKKRTFAAKLKRYTEIGLLDFHLQKCATGTWTYYAFNTDEWDRLSGSGDAKNAPTAVKTATGGAVKGATGGAVKSVTKDPSTISYLDTRSNKSFDLEGSSGAESKEVAKAEPKGLSAMKDETADWFQSKFIAEHPAHLWKSVPQERKQLVRLADMSKLASRGEGLDVEVLRDAVFRAFLEMRRNGKGSYWKDCAVVPSALVQRWNDVVQHLSNEKSPELNDSQKAAVAAVAAARKWRASNE